MLKSWTYKRIRPFLLNHAVRMTLERKAPERFSVQKTTNLRSCYFGVDYLSPPIFIVDGILEDAYQGRLYISESNVLNAKLKKSAAEKMNFFANVYLPGLTIHYNNASKYIFDQVTRYSIARTKIESFATTIRARWIRFHRNRIDLLQRIIEEETLAQSLNISIETFEGKSDVDWYIELYGYEAFAHHMHQKRWAEFRMFLESFASTGDLIKTGDKYAISGKAISTLHAARREDGRHRDIRRQNMWILILTLILAASSVSAVLIDYTNKYHNQLE